MELRTDVGSSKIDSATPLDGPPDVVIGKPDPSTGSKVSDGISSDGSGPAKVIPSTISTRSHSRHPAIARMQGTVSTMTLAAKSTARTGKHRTTEIAVQIALDRSE